MISVRHEEVVVKGSQPPHTRLLAERTVGALRVLANEEDQRLRACESQDPSRQDHTHFVEGETDLDLEG